MKDIKDATKDATIKDAIKDATKDATTGAIIEIVYRMLQDRKVHPSGHFDAAGRFYLQHKELVDVREPSRAYPYSQMHAGRTKKYVKKVQKRFETFTLEELLHHI